MIGGGHRIQKWNCHTSRGKGVPRHDRIGPDHIAVSSAVVQSERTFRSPIEQIILLQRNPQRVIWIIHKGDPDLRF